MKLLPAEERAAADARARLACRAGLKTFSWLLIGVANIVLLCFHDDPAMRVGLGVWIFWSGIMVATGMEVMAKEEEDRP